jgi:hypothetical protein
MVSRRTVFVALWVVLSGCASTSGDHADANVKTTVDASSIFDFLTIRGCATRAGIYNCGVGPAGQPCQVMTPWAFNRA